MEGDFMALSRTESREKIMILLYQALLYEKNNINYDMDDMINNELEEQNEYIYKSLNEILNGKDKLIEIANKYLGSWPMNRLGLTDQSIIMLGIYELMNTDIEGPIIINEAVNLSKKYSDEQVSKIVNGVLDNVYHKEGKDGE